MANKFNSSSPWKLRPRPKALPTSTWTHCSKLRNWVSACALKTVKENFDKVYSHTYSSVAILVSEILDLISAKDFGIWLSIWCCSLSHLVSRKNLVSFLVSGAFFNFFINKKFGNEEKSEVFIFVWLRKELATLTRPATLEPAQQIRCAKNSCKSWAATRCDGSISTKLNRNKTEDSTGRAWSAHQRSAKEYLLFKMLDKFFRSPTIASSSHAENVRAETFLDRLKLAPF